MSGKHHVGLTTLEGERTKLLNEYDEAVKQASDDPVKVEHGISCEAGFRAFLTGFLPKKYGVTKGYIITPDLDYAGPLEEWDIIIYDALESPVLFVRQNKNETEEAGKRGIPVEYVRGVIEVKATFNKAMAGKAVEKLLKLRQFTKFNGKGTDEPKALPLTFRAFAVFYETKVKSARDYQDALSAMTPIWQKDPLIQFFGALIIRGQTCPDFSASIFPFMSGSDDVSYLMAPFCEWSEPFESYVEKINVFAVSSGYGQNEFWKFLLGMIHALNNEDSDLPGMPTPKITGYGQSKKENPNVKLFSSVHH